MPSIHLRHVVALALAVLTIATGPLSAQDRTFTTGASYNLPGNWTPMDVPDTTSENAIIDAGGAWDVSLTGAISVDNVTLGADDGLTIEDTAYLWIRTALDNAGVLTIDGSSNVTALRVLTGTTTLNGAGEVVMLGANATIYDGSGGVDGKLVNQSNTIRGQGALGANTLYSLTNEAAGIISADQNGATLTIDTFSTMTNAGTMQAENGGTLYLSNSVFDNAGGLIQALNGSIVQLGHGAAVTGGTLDTTGTGMIQTTAGQTSSLTALSIPGQVEIVDNSELHLYGAIDNQSTITVNSTANVTHLRIASGTTTLSGGGEVVMVGDDAYFHDNSGSVDGRLINEDNTIRGYGQLGANTLYSIDNQPGGLISADQSGMTLFVNTYSTTTNTGAMQAENGGILSLQAGAYDNTGGVIQALDGSIVQLVNATAVTGGTLDTAGSGIFLTTAGQASSLTTLTVLGPVDVVDSSDLRLYGEIDNQSTITINDAGGTTQLRVASGTTTLSGGGEVVMIGDTAYLYDNSGGVDGRLVNQDNTIRGYGQLGANTLYSIDNQASGLVSADQDGMTLVVNTYSTTTNTGAMQAENGGTLQLLSSTFDNTDGVIQALDDSIVLIGPSTAVTGGTLDTAGSGQFQSTVGGASGLTDLTLGGPVRVVDGSILDLYGTIDNQSTITIDGATTTTQLRVPYATATLTGGGEVVMAGADAYFRDSHGGIDGNLVNQDNTIRGYGSFGSNTLSTLNNQAAGLVSADQSGMTLTVDTYYTTTNTGTMQAENGGILRLQASTFDNTNGVIQALDGSIVQLGHGTAVTGGVMTTAGSGAIQTTDSQNSGLTDVTLQGQLEVVHASILDLYGTTDNQSTITVNGSAGGATLRIPYSTATLTGGGEVVMVGPDATFRDGYGGIDGILINHDNTIRGQGQLGSNLFHSLTNEADGVIAADVNNASLTLNVYYTLANHGTLQATNGGRLDIEDSFTNAGTVVADTASSVVDVNGTLTNTGTLTGIGTIQTLGITQNGIIAPGNSVGTLTLDGDVTNGANATLQIEIAGNTTGDADLLNISGDYHVAGTLAVTFLPGAESLTSADSITIVNADTLTDSVAPAFNAITKRLWSSGDFDVLYDADNGTIKLTDFANIVVAPTVLLGDVDLNSVVDTADIDDFVAALQGTLTVNASLAAADCDQNSVVDTADIDNFIAILQGFAPHAQTQPIPEPTTALLLLALTAATLTRRRRE